MKRKIAVFAALLILAGASLCASRMVIGQLDHSRGEDFIRFHFKADGMPAIPDLFYPDQDNPRLLVMRIRDAEVNIGETDLGDLDSVVASLQVNRSEAYTDIAIHLREQVNYRVYTNEAGLFLEFPEVREVRAVQKSAQAGPAAPEIRRQTAPAGNNSRRTVLNEYRLLGEKDGEVSFALELNREADYKVIALRDQPVRLAIDLNRTSGRRFNDPIGVGRVRNLRGAQNNDEVYRLVFDLEALDHYRVSREGNTLLVTFSDRPLAAAQERTKPEPVKAEPVEPEPVKAEPVTVVQPEVLSPPPVEENTLKTAALKEEKEIEITEIRETPPVQARPETVQAEPRKETFGKVRAEVRPDAGPSAKAVTQEDLEQAAYLRRTIGDSGQQYSGEPVDFAFKNADLNDVLKFIAQISGLNIVVEPGVTGRITCDLYQVPWDQALELFLKINGLDMILEGNILRIGKVESLTKEAEKRRQLREQREQEGKLEIMTHTLSFAKVNEDITNIIKKQLSQRGEVITDARTNTLIISDVPEKLALISQLIDTLDTANPQVAIEARIVESNTSFQQAFGIQWGYQIAADSMYGNQTTLRFPNSIQSGGIPSQNNPFGYAINLPVPEFNTNPFFRMANIANTFAIDAAITAGQKEGKVRIISSPRITTQNNMEADIMQGRQIPIQTIQNNTVTTRYVPAALELKVTPQITARGTIIMGIELANNAADFTNQVQGIPTITTQSSKTSVGVDDGGTIVIGGMFRVEDEDIRDGVPLLSKIPLLGKLFQSTLKRSNQKELLIFITPRIVK